MLYYGTVQLGRSEEETWLMPFGLLMDYIECHRQFLGMAKPKIEYGIDDVLPQGI